MKNKDCEDDCRYICSCCEKTFCEIKEEENLPHQEEIKDAVYLNHGDKFCGDGCYSSYF